MISLISAAHFISHYYMLLLPPLFLFVRDEYDVTFTELGFALAAFNIVSAILQTPAGFLIDRISARVALIGGLLIGSGAIAVAAAVDSFWVLVLMFGVAGLGNTAYHPADYALLSRHVSNERIGHAYSVHAFAGFAGTAAAPVTLLLMESVWGWRGAFFASAAAGAIIAVVLMVVRDGEPVVHAAKPASSVAPPAGWQLLMTGPILRNLLFFILLSVLSAGMNNYMVVALNALHGTPISLGNTALTAYLVVMAIGVLTGGFVTARTDQHGLVTVVGLAVATVFTLLIAAFRFDAIPLILLMVVGGFFTGIIVPARDMIVRASTPDGSFGTVFGFVTTGFSLGGIISPLIFGPAMDHGSPRLVFLIVAAISVLSIAAVATNRTPSRRA